MTWFYEGNPFEDLPEDYIGFVYIITNLLDRRIYVGKKLFKNTKTKKVKTKIGTKRNKKTKTESNWKDYFGSNLELISDVEKLGRDNFKREIVYLCKTKGTANYYEAKLQMEYAVLEREDSYNQWVMVKVHRSHIKK